MQCNQGWPGGMVTVPIFFIISACINAERLSFFLSSVGGSNRAASGLEVLISLKSIVMVCACSVDSILTGNFLRSVAFQTVDSCVLHAGMAVDCFFAQLGGVHFERGIRFAGIGVLNGAFDIGGKAGIHQIGS